MKTFHFLLPLIASLIFASCKKDEEPQPEPEPYDPNTYEPIYDFTTFTFLSNGDSIKGKIYIPESWNTNNNLPVVYLIDYTESHFPTAEDEFDQVIKGVEEIDDFDALVVTLKEHLSIDATPDHLQSFYDTFKDMATYVDSVYTLNTNRTLIGRGSEGGLVLLTLLNENPDSSLFDNFITTDPATDFIDVAISMVQNDELPDYMSNKKLHFSFSSSNDQSLCNQLITEIALNEYPWLTFEYSGYPTDVYVNVYTYSFAEGLNFVFQ